MARIHLLVGPVGAGKSTLARNLCGQHAAVSFRLDQWMAVLFSPDRPDTGVFAWYGERTARCIEQIWQLSESLVELDRDVVLEIGLIRREERERFYQRLESRQLDYTVYVVDAPREIRRERVQRRNDERGDTFSMVVPDDIFEMASDLWEPPDEDEARGRKFSFITSSDEPL